MVSVVGDIYALVRIVVDSGYCSQEKVVKDKDVVLLLHQKELVKE
jgi:hypothetical protein